MKTNKSKTKLDTAIYKSSFFGQYLNQKIAMETKYPNSPTISTNVVLAIEHIHLYHLELKSLSNITKEDAEVLQYTLVNVVGLDGLIRQQSIDLVKEVINNYDQIDCLFMLPSSFSDKVRELGYAIDWNNHKVANQIELGWVKLI